MLKFLPRISGGGGPGEAWWRGSSSAAGPLHRGSRGPPPRQMPGMISRSMLLVRALVPRRPHLGLDRHRRGDVEREGEGDPIARLHPGVDPEQHGVPPARLEDEFAAAREFDLLAPLHPGRIALHLGFVKLDPAHGGARHAEQPGALAPRLEAEKGAAGAALHRRQPHPDVAYPYRAIRRRAVA